MKIGILTFHTADNYGAVLQCYALQEYLKGKGHKVSVLDYRNSYLTRIYRKSDFRMFMANLVYGHKLEIKSLILRNRKIPKFASFREKHLYIDNTKFINVKDVPKDFDMYVIGSDQLWNYSVCGDVYDPVYWGDFRKDCEGKIITYAVSTSVKSLTEMPKDLLLKYLANFDKISVREKSLLEYLRSITDKRISVLVDPTILLDSHHWSKLAGFSTMSLPEKYILVYSVRNYPGNNNIMYDKALILSKKRSLPILVITKETSYSPEDFVNLFKNATCVFTSSFHGTVFSVIFKRCFYTYKYNDAFDSRYVDLLESLGLEDRLLSVEQDTTELKDVDYSKVDERLMQLRNATDEYFQDLI